MRINKFSMALLCFLFQCLVFYPVARKLTMLKESYLIFLVFALAILGYQLLTGCKLSPRGLFQLFSLVTLLIFLISGVFFTPSLALFIQFLIWGISTGMLSGLFPYYCKKILLLGVKENQYPFFIESLISIFAVNAYTIGLLLSNPSFPFWYIFIGAFFISLILSFVLINSVNAVIQQSLQDITEDRPPLGYINALVSLKNFYEVCQTFFARTRSSIGEIENLSKEIRNSAEDLSSASEEMNASLQEVSSTIQHIAKGAQDQSDAITAIARSIEELDNLTTSISSQVKMANVSARRTTESAKKGMEFTTQQARVLKEIFDQTRDIEEKMAKLRDQATEIKKVVDIIQGITEQTDLLALNAAIEAARVGEQGKGFAVVADEIRNLANETQRSSTVVENLILEINKTIQELNNLLNQEREKIDEANVSASQTEEEFTGIVKAVNLVTDMVGRINDAAANQLTHTKELVKKVEQVAQVAADTAAATEEVSAAVEEQTASMEQFTSTAQLLSQVVAKLNEIVSGLKK
ncbi:MAG: methyl-accepting chemotaxis protein [candidate division WOR-3 bacterium]